jgi:RNase P subunit RPR2
MEFFVIVNRRRTFAKQLNIGICLAEITTMKFFCRHCDKVVIGRPYRVTSEENGVTLLDMTVCHSCDEQARALGLHSEAVRSASRVRKHHRQSEYPGAGTNG